MDLSEMILKQIGKQYKVTEEDIGADARMERKGMHFTVRSLEIEGVGHLCSLKMTAMLGLMKMDTVVIAPEEKDVPLINLDYVKAMGQETLIVELYDTMLGEMPEKAHKAYLARKNADADLPDYVSGPHWYDPIKMDGSYAKKGRRMSARLNRAAEDYMELFSRELAEAPACDREARRAKNEGFAQGLLDNGGPAVDQVRKLFGEERTRKLIRKYMYGVE